MASADPAYLPLGTEVSAKYRGAFCEAKVKKIVKQLKIKVQYQVGGSAVVSHENVTGPLKAGCTVEVKFDEADSKTATITKITDQSQYTVVFDDGDENTLRRTQLCLKSEKHFLKYDTLDDLPLTHPEHFGTPVLKGKSKKRRAATSPHSSDSESESDSDEPAPRQYPGRLEEMVGKLLLMTQEDRKKTMIVPVLVVQPNADTTELRTRDHLLVKSFKDSKFYAVTKKECKEFTRDAALKNDDKTLKPVYEKALLFFDAKELPPHWDKDDLFGSDSEEDDDDDVSSDDEQSEEKDMFVAQLYKFMDERGTPINKAPLVGSRDLNLYRLFRVVHKLGGYNRVTNQMKWRLVYSKMGLPNNATAANQIKTAYKRYLHAFEDFYRKLGSSMGTGITRPSRSRHSSGRTIPGFRDRDRPDSVSPKSPRNVPSSLKKEAKKEIKEETSEEEIQRKEPVSKPVSASAASPDMKPTRKSTGVNADVAEDISPSKRKTRGGVEEKAASKLAVPQVKETKSRPGSVKSAAESDASEKEDMRRKKPVKKRMIKQEEKQEDEEDKDETETESNKSETESTSGKATTPSNKAKLDTTYPCGSRLRVRYGKGKNHQVFQAKVIDSRLSDQGVTQWLVHYEGWNTRYDEWVIKGRIVEAVHIPDSKSSEPAKKPTSLALNKTSVGPTKIPSAGPTKAPGHQARTPTGQAKTPVGQTKAAIGQAKTPVGQTKTLAGQAKTPVGQAKTPVGQPKVMTNQAKSVANPAKTPANQVKGQPGSVAKTPFVKSNANPTKNTTATPGTKTVAQVKAPASAAKTPAAQARLSATTPVKARGTPLVKKKSQTKIVTKSQKEEKSQRVGRTKKTKAPRPTRSTSIESSLSTGLSPRKRPRRNSGYTEASGRGDSSSESEESDDEDENESDVGGKTPPYASPKSAKGDDPMDSKSDDSKLQLPKEASDFDIMKELEDFDKASQDSLEGVMNLDEDAMSGMDKNETEEFDIKSMLSCLTKDEDKIQSSENESVVSTDTERRTGRGRSKTKSADNLKIKADIISKSKPDKVKSESETESAPTRGQRLAAAGKAKVDAATKAKSEPPAKAAKLEIKTKAAVKAKPDSIAQKSDSTKPKLGSPKAQKADSSNIASSASPKAKMMSPKVVISSPKSKLLSPKSAASPKSSERAVSPKVDQKVKVELERLKEDPVVVTVVTEGSDGEESTTKTNNLTKDIEMEPLDFPQDETEDKKPIESKKESSDVNEEKQESTEKPREDSEDDKTEQSEKDQSTSSSTDDQSSSAKEKDKDEKPTKPGGIATATKKVLKGRGRGKRKAPVEKEETADSEEEPTRKKPRRRKMGSAAGAKKESESSSKSSDGNADEETPTKTATDKTSVVEDMDCQDAATAPKLSATPTSKMEEQNEESDEVEKEQDSATEETAPPLSPVAETSSKPSPSTAQPKQQQPSKAAEDDDKIDSLNTFDLRGAMQSPAKSSSTAAPAALTASSSTLPAPPPHSNVGDKLTATTKPSISASAVIEDTPPSTPPGSEFPGGGISGGNARPSPPKIAEPPNSEAASTKSELEANMEVESYLKGALPPGGSGEEESPNAGAENSNMSTPSEEGNSVQPTKPNEASPQPQPTPPPAQTQSRKSEEPAAVAPSSAGRKRKRGGKAGAHTHHHHHHHHKKGHEAKPAIASDEDDGKEAGHGRAALSDHNKCSRGPSKYNFIQQLDEGKYLEGEERVNFLLTKIADLRSIYMQLKQEVASIDRRRKRHRKKQRLAAQGLIGLESALS